MWVKGIFIQKRKNLQKSCYDSFITEKKIRKQMMMKMMIMRMIIMMLIEKLYWEQSGNINALTIIQRWWWEKDDMPLTQGYDGNKLKRRRAKEKAPINRTINKRRMNDPKTKMASGEQRITNNEQRTTYNEQRTRNEV